MPTDFFVSYTAANKRWAEWIAFTLEAAGFSTVIQAWDFRPGSNFVLEMQNAAAAAERTIMVLSPEYVNSQFAAPEWAAAFSSDPKGIDKKLVPVRVAACDMPGLLKPIVHIDVVGLDEAEARDTLLSGVSTKRAKPSKPPTFPGTVGMLPEHKAFPGPSSSSQKGTEARTAYMPKVKRAASDSDKRQLLKQTMEASRNHFRKALVRLESEAQGISTDLEEVSSREFFAEISSREKASAVAVYRRAL